ncbi:hypothetical protein CAP36_12960 [Chitinophagaceae bacterium IBVUCB2]|nr:hypothetical protein CAP36_12960 [Chitinophagaceae bacterium IBVUCB2]
MKKILVIATVIISLAAVVGIQSCQSTKSATGSKMMKFNFEKGRGYDYEMIMNLDQEVMGAKQQIDMSTYYSMLVTEDDGALKTIKTTFDRFKMNMGVMGMQIEVDTEKPFTSGLDTSATDNPLAMVNRLLGAIKGQQFVMKVDAEGKVQDVQGFQEMGMKIADSLGLDEAKKKEMLQSFSQQFNERNIKEQFERVLYIFPNKEVKVGDSWQKKTTTTGPMGGTYNSTYTVKEIEGDMVTLEEKTKIESDNEQMKLSGEQTGELVVDSRTGLVVSADMDLNMETTNSGTKVNMRGKTKIKGQAR